ncbi:hypothetical protein BKE38_03955 [Pseudoroseomonas deserti]|uniref:Probable RNA 2'-phosphotransferase n=1 Tax=Teichococcus deserti TaxID=1817963 RepID=A0A1V2H8M7_9PROT|nr:RNA 2'-phosphotransferase [Pseudoroseomonas deserti]ONG57875.1 hypothetical protein BKE38_03955 [Pseudoroseomonas deserti]
MTPKDPALVQASKAMALLLRHDPAAGGISLDAEGWTPVEALLRGLQRLGHPLDRAALDALVAGDAKTRYAVSADGARIRANQGHSLDGVALAHRAAVPPAVLYHGTVARCLEAILREGLRPMARHHVHLSAEPATARAVGQRRGTPVVLQVDAAALQAEGAVFRRSENGVWLCDHVPPHRLALLPAG